VAQRFQRCGKVPVDERLQPPRCRMAAPFHGNTGHGVYFITASTFQKQSLFQSDRMRRLLLNVLFHYRDQERFLLHEFVIMPDHFHLLITPIVTLEKTMQLIQGGFSYRVKRELEFMHKIWQPSYYDRRVRDFEELLAYSEYIRQNPVKKGLVSAAQKYVYGSAWPKYQLDEAPQRLKPIEYMSN
jgi:putative transposase